MSNQQGERPDWFKFMWREFLIGTQGMSDAAVGRYIKLLCHQFDKGQVNPDLVEYGFPTKIDVTGYVTRVKIEQKSVNVATDSVNSVTDSVGSSTESVRVALANVRKELATLADIPMTISFELNLMDFWSELEKKFPADEEGVHKNKRMEVTRSESDERIDNHRNTAVDGRTIAAIVTNLKRGRLPKQRFAERLLDRILEQSDPQFHDFLRNFTLETTDNDRVGDRKNDRVATDSLPSRSESLRVRVRDREIVNTNNPLPLTGEPEPEVATDSVTDSDGNEPEKNSGTDPKKSEQKNTAPRREKESPGVETFEIPSVSDRNGPSCLYLPSGSTSTHQEIFRLLKGRKNSFWEFGDLIKRPMEFRMFVLEEFCREKIADNQGLAEGMYWKDWQNWARFQLDRLQKLFNQRKKDADWFDRELTETVANISAPAAEVEKFRKHYLAPQASGQLYFQTLAGFEVANSLPEWLNRVKDQPARNGSTRKQSTAPTLSDVDSMSEEEQHNHYGATDDFYKQ